jgi:hypothetical protein
MTPSQAYDRREEGWKDAYVDDITVSWWAGGGYMPVGKVDSKSVLAYTGIPLL